MTTFTTAYTNNVISNDQPLPLILLEIAHEDLEQGPIRLVRNNEDITHQGNNYIRSAFDVSLPNQDQETIPTARIVVDKLDAETTRWIRITNGGVGAVFTIKEILTDDMDTVQAEIALVLTKVNYTFSQLFADLRYDIDFEDPAIQWRFTPSHAPGLYR